ncbi:MAG: LPS export ABC transporter permease LptG [Acetobacteraceae bacterium]
MKHGRLARALGAARAVCGPGPALDRYIARAVLRATLLVAFGLTALFSLLALVEELRLVGQGRYRLGGALVYVLLTAPLRLVRTTPVALLLGSLLALGALGRNSELMAMQSLGISGQRVVGAVLRLIAPVTLALFLLTQFVVPPARGRAEALRAAALGPAADAPGAHGFWASGPDAYLHVRRWRGATGAEGIAIYAFAANGQLARAITAEHAEIGPGRDWTLYGVRESTVEGERLQTHALAVLHWHAFASTAQLRTLALPLAAMPPVGLLHEVLTLRREHRQGLRYALELWRRIAIPLTMIAMILAAAPFLFAPPRMLQLGRLLTAGAVIGIVFTLVQQITAHLALLLGLDAPAAALAPPLALIALALLLRRVDR